MRACELLELLEELCEHDPDMEVNIASPPRTFRWDTGAARG